MFTENLAKNFRRFINMPTTTSPSRDAWTKNPVDYNTLEYGMQRTLRFMEEIKESTLEQLEFEMFQV